MKPACLASLGCLVLALTCPAQQMAWTQLKPVTSPLARLGHAMVYDSVRQRTVLFGGWTGTWEWDGRNWTDVKPATSPVVRWGLAMAYDSARNRAVLFGGNDIKGRALPGTWEWDGKNWMQSKPATSPRNRSRHAMVYDPVRRRTLLFGGWNVKASSSLADTWEWDGKNWAQIKPATSPSTRYWHAMAYDSARQRTVLFGGFNSRRHLADTWEWDGKNWAQIKPTTSPPIRRGHAMVYDSTRRRTMLFGGSIGRLALEDIWEWDGKNWTQIKTTTGPWPRAFHTMVYDPARQRTVLFGGWSCAPQRDTWVWRKATLTTNTSTVSAATGGTQLFSLDAGTEHATRSYWLLGSATGNRPGISLGGVHFPLNPDFYTDFTIAFANTAVLINTRGKLNGTGRGAAFLKVPKGLQLRFSTTLHHAYLVYDAQGKWHMVSNPVPLKLVK